MERKLLIDSKAKYIIDKLNNNGYSAYIVGGSLRNLIMNKPVNDWDICTSAKPKDIKNIFDKTIDTGIQHGTVTIVLDDKNYEVTTFRIDGEYDKNRKPKTVTYVESLYEDLKRRDFTINAIAYNHKNGIVDPFNGINDINEGLIKCVGNPDERFNEDPLRMMRAVRLACQLNFIITKDTALSMFNNKELIKNVSAERIRNELCKILISDQPSFGIDLLRATDLLGIILPEINNMVHFNQHNPNHHKDLYKHTLYVLDNVYDNLIVRLSALFHDVGKVKTFSLDENGKGHFYRHHVVGMDMTKNILHRLRFDNKTIEAVCILVKEHMSRYDFLRKSNIKKFINRVGIENLDNLFDLQIADIKASKPPHDITNILDLKEKVEKTLKEKEPLITKDLEIDGYDLIDLGIKPGIEMGKMLNELLEMVLENSQLNNRKDLLSIVKDKIN